MALLLYSRRVFGKTLENLPLLEGFNMVKLLDLSRFTDASLNIATIEIESPISNLKWRLRYLINDSH